MPIARDTVEDEGREVLLVDAARRMGLTSSTLRKRRQLGWSDAQMLGRMPPPDRYANRKPHSGRKYKRIIPPDEEAVLFNNEALEKRSIAEEGDRKFCAAMLAAGYEPYVNTTPCTENPITVRPPPSLRSRSYWNW